jgi:hypothetical protein
MGEPSLRGKIMHKWSEEEKKTLPKRYSCELIFDATTLEIAKDKNLPSDGYLVWYKLNDQKFLDVCRGRKMADIFDLYYDKFGPNCVQKIDFGYGTRNPKLWGYTAPEGKKKR